jgi:peptidoglycan/xylan/chitin deacetylase (PgdA/CDA1 family)
MTALRRRLRDSLACPLVVLVIGCAVSASTPDSARATRGRSAGEAIRVPVLVYHSIAQQHPGQTGEQRELDVDPATFRAEMDYLAREHHPVVSFADLIDALVGRATLPPSAVVITFDDGWKNQFTAAFPVLRHYGFTATFFVYTDAISNGSAFMTWDDLRTLEQAGMTIGSHSRSHPMLTVRGVPLNEEIEGSREDIMRHLGTAPEFFAYPYGDVDHHVVDLVRTAGYLGARGMGEGPGNAPSDRYAVKSVLATGNMSAFVREVSDLPGRSLY